MIINMLMYFYCIGGFLTLLFYINDMSDEKWSISKLSVAIIAALLFPLFWLLRAIIAEGMK